jgi:ribonuclease R
MRYALGARVQVQVSRVDLDGRRIDFRLVTGEDELLLRAMRDKTGAAVPGGEGGDSNARTGKGRRNRQGDDDRGNQDRSAKGGASAPKDLKASGQRAAVKSAGRGSARAPGGKSRKSRR